MTELTLRQKEFAALCLDIVNLLGNYKPKPIKCYGLEDHQLSYERSCIKCGTSKKDLVPHFFIASSHPFAAPGTCVYVCVCVVR